MKKPYYIYLIIDIFRTVTNEDESPEEGDESQEGGGESQEEVDESQEGGDESQDESDESQEGGDASSNTGPYP